jgi:hypothetical protein
MTARSARTTPLAAHVVINNVFVLMMLAAYLAGG